MSSLTTVPPNLPIAPSRPVERRTGTPVPSLENGAHLSGSEFMRRYEAAPEVKKAELIQGVVCMASPVRADLHGEPDSLIQGLILLFAAHSEFVRTGTNTTVRFGPDDIPQPDAFMRILPEFGGMARLENGFVTGPPELVVEIAASSASRDMHEKLDTYRRFAVPEYLAWLTEEERIVWLRLLDDKYVPLQPDAEGVVKSIVFPGFWLDVPAVLAFDRVRAIATVERGIASPEHAEFVKRPVR